ncbi:hypothetical protein BSU04_36770 [Caballeronia sordidicola]|uniref:Uncharacterized protein n=1 Tax=Caballeronia sordidicola TaxID=196367 RepID=A0A226WQL2_CABSO|nr:hypothetical protein BSU04_36770 [Caballeronia sordidicola]
MCLNVGCVNYHRDRAKLQELSNLSDLGELTRIGDAARLN